MIVSKIDVTLTEFYFLNSSYIVDIYVTLCLADQGLKIVDIEYSIKDQTTENRSYFSDPAELYDIIENEEDAKVIESDLALDNIRSILKSLFTKEKIY